MPGQVKVGVGLYILNNRNQLLLGLRRGAHGAGTCALRRTSRIRRKL